MRKLRPNNLTEKRLEWIKDIRLKGGFNIDTSSVDWFDRRVPYDTPYTIHLRMGPVLVAGMDLFGAGCCSRNRKPIMGGKEASGADGRTIGPYEGFGD